MKRRCLGVKEDGTACRAAPLLDHDWCMLHSPDHREEAAEARRLGGLRRRRESTLQSAYQFEGVRTIDDVRRVVEIAIHDTLALDNSPARNKALGTLAQTALKVLNVGELEDRVQALEAMLAPRSARSTR